MESLDLAVLGDLKMAAEGFYESEDGDPAPDCAGLPDESPPPFPTGSTAPLPDWGQDRDHFRSRMRRYAAPLRERNL